MGHLTTFRRMDFNALELPGGHFEIGPDVINAARDWMAAKL
mgnify:CR=1 FL=1